MTEVDTVMHEGGAPVPGSPTNNQTNNTNSFIDSSLNDAETAEHDDTVAASNNGTANEMINKIIPLATAPAIPKEATVKIKTVKNAQTITGNKSSSQQLEKSIKSMEVDNDGGGGDGDVGNVSTTTMEQECEEDSQVTSSSTDIDGKHESNSGIKHLKPRTLQSSASLNENSNSNSQQHQEGGDDDDDDDDDDDGDGDGEENDEKEEISNAVISSKKVKEKISGGGGGVGLGNESSQSFDCFNNESQQSSISDNQKPNKVVAANTDESSIDSEKSQTKTNEANDDDKNAQNEIAPSFENAKIVDKPSGSEPMEVDDDDGDNDDEAENEADPLGGASNDATTTTAYEDSKNGIASDAEKATKIADNNGAIVDLDDTDDDDDDEDDEAEELLHKKQKTNGNEKNLKLAQASISKPHSVCSDSDDAVLIGSDSESELNTNSPKLAKKPNQASPPPPRPRTTTTTTTTTQIIDDDDDDCVVIEDDSPPIELTANTSSNNDQAKRKSVVIDAEPNSDDSQPPSKRQRNAAAVAVAVAIGTPNTPPQLTIKDARSITPADLSSVGVGAGAGVGGNVRKSMGGNDANIYPVNITPAAGAGGGGVGSSNLNLNTPIGGGPPKLAPLGGGPVIGGSGGVIPGLTSINSNANLLPGLTDDMFVLEAPSFIVPYIYEKPPGDNLKDIVKTIESKYELTKDDLTDADKSDEFDMITEQNKSEREQKHQEQEQGKKKKKRRGGDDVDDSWSEESDEDDDEDDDDDSDSNVRTKVLIKEATDDLTALKSAIKSASAVAQQTPAPATAAAASATANVTKPGQENYFESPLGKFFMDIGVGLVQEFVQSDLIRLQKRKMRKSYGQTTTDFERAIAALSGNLEASKKKNSPFKFTMKRCEFCNFKSESVLSMAHHYETPHMNGPLYKCNFCTFEIRNATEIVYHMEAMHNIKARLIKPLPYHQCPNCGFEDNGKAKLARHQPVCAKKFRPDLNLAPPNDWEAPAKIPRIKPRHGLVGTATAYQAMAAQAAAQKAALATIQQQQQQAQARNIQAAALAAQNAAKIRGRTPMVGGKAGGIAGSPNGTSVLRGQSSVGPRAMATNVVLPNNYQLPGNQILQANALSGGKKTSLPGQPSISITPLPRQGSSPQTSAPSTSKMPPAGMKPGKNPTGGNSKAQFVICEICDGYIKDLEQLRNHMQWMHEVKIHPKMIYNRPPLNCQKCQFRFFTDQGLERHLLGSHGLVTSSMQEAANKGKDAGRCPVCGRMYQWKLLNHVARDHHMTLKPAHLSYKCTVCTATFGMYKQFETHVYTAHSTVAKKAMDGKKNAAATGVNSNTAGGGASSASNSSNQRAAANDALLKPLKINDEITIIPQPASKPRITNIESHVID